MSPPFQPSNRNVDIDLMRAEWAHQLLRRGGSEFRIESDLMFQLFWQIHRLRRSESERKLLFRTTRFRDIIKLQGNGEEGILRRNSIITALNHQQARQSQFTKEGLDGDEQECYYRLQFTPSGSLFYALRDDMTIKEIEPRRISPTAQNK